MLQQLNFNRNQSEMLDGRQMADSEIRNLLLIGIDVTPLAYSARKAGYKVYSVDYFGDRDLRSVSNAFFSIIKQREGGSCGRLSADFDAEILLRGAREISSKNPIDAILLSAGLDDSPRVLSELSEIAPIIGNSPRLIQKVRDKEQFIYELERLGVPFPATVITDDLSEASKASKDIGYPLLVKPTKGFGGAGIKKIGSSGELEKFFKNLPSREKILIQEYIPGIAASASVISTGTESVALTVNEQLIGLNSLGQLEPFGYCGNIVPLHLSEDILSTCKELAEKIVTHFRLVGSNGVDLVISKDGVPYAIEVNPRFQSTLECVENVLGINMVETHMDACIRGVLPKHSKEISKFCTRLILFAPCRSIVPDLSEHSEVRDIPFPGVIIEKGEPVCSVISEGKDRDSSFNKAKELAERIISSMKPTDTVGI